MYPALLQKINCSTIQLHETHWNNTGGHAGYEVAPFIPTLEHLLALALNGPRDADKDQALNTVQHHDMHHRCGNALAAQQLPLLHRID